MIEILCLSHRGVRCAMPSKQVLLVESIEHAAQVVHLWDAVGGLATPGQERWLRILTSCGPKWLCGTRPKLRQIAQSRVFGLPGVLRDFLPLSHVVGLADLEDELVWLVDTQRWAPINRNGIPSANDDCTEGGTA